MTAPSKDSDTIGENYLIEKYCLSRYQARRLLLNFGHDRAELERLLGAAGRTQDHRSQDVEQTAAEIAFGP